MEEGQKHYNLKFVGGGFLQNRIVILFLSPRKWKKILF